MIFNKKNILLCLLVTNFMSVSCRNQIVSQEDISKEKALQSGQSIYDFTVYDIDSNEVSLSQYKGKILLIVNVASKCGNTPQYAGLEQLYEKYKDQGLVILGFPSNDFLKQEPGNNAEIKSFCQSTYGVQFPMFSKIHVRGKDIAPLYQFLTEKDKNGVLNAPVTWNFQKFLVNRTGQIVASFQPRTKVEESIFQNTLKKIL